MKHFKFFRGIIPDLFHVDGFEFMGYSAAEYDWRTFTYTARRYMIYKSLESGETIRGPIIYDNDPNWDAPAYIE